MKTSNFRVLFLYIAFVLLVLIMGKSTPAHATEMSSPLPEGPVKLVVKGGELSFAVGTPSSLVSTPLDNSMQKVSYTVPVVVTDATGSGDGWILQLATNSEASSQSAGTPFITGMVVRCAVDSTCSLPMNTVSYSNPISLGADTTPVFSAAHDTGMGMILLNVKVSVVLPANVSLSDYNENLAFALSNTQIW
jgi:hypothetical protein